MTRITRPTRTLPDRPDLSQLRRQAKDLLKAFRQETRTRQRTSTPHYHDADRATFALHHAQLVIARAYGFDSWPRLKAHVDGITARRFIEAARRDERDTVAAMLDVRADLIDMQWSYGDERRALHYAVMNRSAGLVRLLMRRGADARVGVHPHRDATTPLTMARERRFREIVEIIESAERTRAHAPASGAGQPTPDVTSPGPRPVAIEADVCDAVMRGDTAWLRARHLRKPIANTISWDRGGLLTLAAYANQPAVLELLLDIGFDPDERVRWNEGPDAAYSQGYPLWHCAATGKQAMAELLLRRGADPNVHVDSSGSSVYAAYSHRQWVMVDLLKRHGGLVTPDTVGLYREKALAEEMLAGSADRAFIDAAVPDERTLEDFLLEFALSGGADEIVGMALERIDWPRDDPRWFRMLERGTDFWNHIPWLYAGNKEFDRRAYITGFRRLVERCDPNVIGGFRRTALHEVAAIGDHVTDAEASALAAILLNAGARTTVRDELFDSTPLGWACRWGRAGIVRALLEHGADPVEADAEPWSRPRAWAETMNRDGVLAVLREHGA